ncbi:unnamed protein product [Ixodes hexagonus]
MKLETTTRTGDETRGCDVTSSVATQHHRRPASNNSSCVDILIYLGVILVVGVLVCMAVRICQDEDEPTVASYHALVSRISLYEDSLKDVRSCLQQDSEWCTKHPECARAPSEETSCRTVIEVPSSQHMVELITKQIVPN